MAGRTMSIAYVGNGKGTNRYHIPFVPARPEQWRIADRRRLLRGIM